MTARLTAAVLQACAAAADDVYPGDDRFDFERLGRDDVLLQENGARVLCRRSAQRIVVAFQGTDVAAGELANNFRVWPKRAPAGGLAVAGYLDYCLAVWPALRAWLEQHADGGFAANSFGQRATRAGRPVWVCGHSRGGAAAIDATHLWEFAGCVTFGSPKPGNAAFWRACRCAVWRVVIKHDFAPEYPSVLGIPVPGWTQGGQELRLEPGHVRRVAYQPLASRGRQDRPEHAAELYRRWSATVGAIAL